MLLISSLTPGPESPRLGGGLETSSSPGTLQQSETGTTEIAGLMYRILTNHHLERRDLYGGTILITEVECPSNYSVLNYLE